MYLKLLNNEKFIEKINQENSRKKGYYLMVGKVFGNMTKNV